MDNQKSQGNGFFLFGVAAFIAASFFFLGAAGMFVVNFNASPRGNDRADVQQEIKSEVLKKELELFRKDQATIIQNELAKVRAETTKENENSIDRHKLQISTLESLKTELSTLRADRAKENSERKAPKMAGELPSEALAALLTETKKWHQDIAKGMIDLKMEQAKISSKLSSMEKLVSTTDKKPDIVEKPMPPKNEPFAQTNEIAEKALSGDWVWNAAGRGPTENAKLIFVRGGKDRKVIIGAAHKKENFEKKMQLVEINYEGEYAEPQVSKGRMFIFCRLSKMEWFQDGKRIETDPIKPFNIYLFVTPETNSPNFKTCEAYFELKDDVVQVFWVAWWGVGKKGNETNVTHMLKFHRYDVK